MTYFNKLCWTSEGVCFGFVMGATDGDGVLYLCSWRSDLDGETNLKKLISNINDCLARGKGRNNIMFNNSLYDMWELEFYRDYLSKMSPEDLVSKYGKDYVDEKVGHPPNPFEIEARNIKNAE